MKVAFKGIVLLLAVLLALSSVSCSPMGEGMDAGEVLCAVFSTVEDAGGRGIIYFDRTRNTENGDTHVISEEKLGYLYTGRIEPLQCADRIESYAVRLPSDMGGCELHVIKCLNPSDCTEVAAFFEKRIGKLKASEVLSIAPETCEKCFLGAEVYQKGRFVFLIATSDNAAVIKAIEGVL